MSDEQRGRVIGPDDQNDFEDALGAAVTKIHEAVSDLRPEDVDDLRPEEDVKCEAVFDFPLRRPRDLIETEAANARGERQETPVAEALKLEVMLDIRDLLQDLLEAQSAPAWEPIPVPTGDPPPPARGWPWGTTSYGDGGGGI